MKKAQQIAIFIGLKVSAGDLQCGLFASLKKVKRPNFSC